MCGVRYSYTQRHNLSALKGRLRNVYRLAKIFAVLLMSNVLLQLFLVCETVDFTWLLCTNLYHTIFFEEGTFWSWLLHLHEYNKR